MLLRFGERPTRDISHELTAKFRFAKVSLRKSGGFKSILVRRLYLFTLLTFVKNHALKRNQYHDATPLLQSRVRHDSESLQIIPEAPVKSVGHFGKLKVILSGAQSF